MTDHWQEEIAHDEKSTTLTTRRFLHQLKGLLPESCFIVNEMVMHSSLAHRYLARPGSYLKVGSGGLGLGMGQAAGVKLAQQEQPLVFLVGDGTFNYNPVLAALGVCQEYRLPMLTVILNNGGYGAIAHTYHRLLPEGWAARHHEYLGVDIAPPPDYASIATAFGAAGYQITTAEDITPVITDAVKQLADNRAALVDVVLPPRS